jgi:ElaB/YqjD/DUF883 family membrane-anchored ribosome-binding protein
MVSSRARAASSRLSGSLRKSAAKSAGDVESQARGTVRAAAARMHDAYGTVAQEVVDDFRQVADGVREITTDQPVATLLGAMGVGVLLGFMLGRR